MSATTLRHSLRYAPTHALRHVRHGHTDARSPIPVHLTPCLEVARPGSIPVFQHSSTVGQSAFDFAARKQVAKEDNRALRSMLALTKDEGRDLERLLPTLRSVTTLSAPKTTLSAPRTTSSTPVTPLSASVATLQPSYPRPRPFHQAPVTTRSSARDCTVLITRSTVRPVTTLSLAVTTLAVRARDQLPGHRQLHAHAPRSLVRFPRYCDPRYDQLGA